MEEAHTNDKNIKFQQNGYIAKLTLDLQNSKVNILKSTFLLELETHLDEIKSDSEIKILLIESAKEGNFIAGADINEIESITTKEKARELVSRGQEIITKIADLPCITVCYINGICMGGGTELALSCDFRISSREKSVKIALPEVQLGIIPGFGGTQRLPRLIGLSRAIPMIVSGKTLDYNKANRVGLVDFFIDKEFYKQQIDSKLEKIIQNKEKLIKSRRKKPLIEKIPFIRNAIFKIAKKQIIAKTKGQYPAPLLALSVVKKTHAKSITKGLKIELDAFCEICIGQISKNLTNLFLTSQAIKKTYKEEAINPYKDQIDVKHAGVLGAGVMGGGIAWFYSKMNIPVRMKDITWNSIALGYNQVEKIYDKLVKIRKLDKSETENKKGLVTGTLEYNGFKNCDIISEAVIENMDIKKQVIAEIEEHVQESCIIASNTSSLSVDEMGANLQRPENFIGMHFFNPVSRMPLVEVIVSKRTSPRAIATVLNLVEKSGKTPIIVKNDAGFLVNRVLLTYINEAFYILDESGDIERIDRIVKDFGMPMGPFELTDIVGLDVGYKVSQILKDRFGDRMNYSPLIDKIYNEKKLLGKKLGKGLYIYNGDKKPPINGEIKPLCKGSKKIPKNEIIDRLILVMVNEAARCLEEEIVGTAKEVDLAMIMGTGFPPFEGGLLKYADNRGIGNVVARLKELEEAVSQKFKPCEYLLSLDNNKKTFYN